MAPCVSSPTTRTPCRSTAIPRPNADVTTIVGSRPFTATFPAAAVSPASLTPTAPTTCDGATSRRTSAYSAALPPIASQKRAANRRRDDAYAPASPATPGPAPRRLRFATRVRSTAPSASVIRTVPVRSGRDATSRPGPAWLAPTMRPAPPTNRSAIRSEVGARNAGARTTAARVIWCASRSRGNASDARYGVGPMSVRASSRANPLGNRTR